MIHWLFHTNDGQLLIFWVVYLGLLTLVLWWLTPSEEERLAARVAKLEKRHRENVEREPKRLL